MSAFHHITLVCGESESGKSSLIRRRFGNYKLVPKTRALTERSIDVLRGAVPGDSLVIEYPEICLSQRQQTWVGHEAIEALRRGVCVVLETHSQHIFDRIRRGLKRGEIQPQSVEILFCTSEGDSISLSLDADGRLGHWPRGFMDEIDQFHEAFL